MELTIGTTLEFISKAQLIRRQVFVDEQSIPREYDLDGLDEESHHILVTDSTSIVASARLYPVDSKHAVMARIAVLKEYRCSGIGTKMVSSLMLQACEMGYSSLEIHAHEHLRSYYEKFGFVYIQNSKVVGAYQLIEMRYEVASR